MVGKQCISDVKGSMRPHMPQGEAANQWHNQAITCWDVANPISHALENELSIKLHEILFLCAWLHCLASLCALHVAGCRSASFYQLQDASTSNIFLESCPKLGMCLHLMLPNRQYGTIERKCTFYFAV